MQLMQMTSAWAIAAGSAALRIGLIAVHLPRRPIHSGFKIK
jgi:hypothetical protein